MTDVLLSLFWTLAGLCVGYCIGRAGRLAAESEPEMTKQEPHGRRPGRAVRLGSQIFGALLVVLALSSVVLGVAYVSRQSAVVRCQNEYNRAFAVALTERNEAAAREREGQRHLLAAAFRPPEEINPGELAAAYQAYLALLAQADAQRNANPLPVQTC